MGSLTKLRRSVGVGQHHDGAFALAVAVTIVCEVLAAAVRSCFSPLADLVDDGGDGDDGCCRDHDA